MLRNQWNVRSIQRCTGFYLFYLSTSYIYLPPLLHNRGKYIPGYRGRIQKKNASIRNQLHSRNTHFYTYQYLNLNHLYWEPDPEACQSKRVLASDRSSKLPIKNFAWDVIIQNGVVFHQFKYRLGKLYAFVCVIFRTCHWI